MIPSRAWRIARAVALTAAAAVAAALPVPLTAGIGEAAAQIPPITVPSNVQLLTPQAGDTLLVDFEVQLEASVDKTVSEVAFFSNSSRIGSANVAPYTVTWTPATQGTHSLRAVATELNGTSTSSPQVAVGVTNPQSLRLIQKADLVYHGAFKVPLGAFGSTTFAWGGTAAAFSPERNSIFMVGHDHEQKVAEISIPEIRTSDYATAELRQPMTDVLEGKIGQINPSDPNSKKIGGLLPYLGKLYVTAYSYYDGEGSQSTSHFVSGLDLSVPGDVKGPYRIGRAPSGFVSGYFGLIPQAWRALFGGPVLNGNCCLSIISRTSYGPAAYVVDPAQIGGSGTAAATPVVYYTADRPMARWEDTSPYFNGTTHIRGLVFPDNTRSVLFFGRQGTGPFCYGSGDACKDPTDNSQGTHAYPYRYQVWAYDALDLLLVKQNKKRPEDIRPYAIWALDNFPVIPWGVDLQGATYDPATGRIFVVQKFGDGEKPLVHVYTVAGSR